VILQGRKAEKRISDRNAVTRRPDGMRGVSRRTGQRTLYRRFSVVAYLVVRQIVICVAQAEHPTGQHMGQSNLPNRRGT